MTNLGLTDEQLNLITKVFSQEPRIQKAVVFGSRAKGNFKKYSDVDIALFGDLTSSDTEHIKLNLDELPMIYEFDVISYNELKNPQLKDHIDRVGQNIYVSPK
ncbi:MAG: nucleotidyltransferase domain-containing protein [Heliobacteriaceae bacterium]|jgi:predicted nucleotidyltransferase|nr:nucleotidyltransferase domain-containing protein [Heliobacteriaceae bacterium]